MGMTVLIPWLVGRGGRRDRRAGDRADLLPLALAIVGAGRPAPRADRRPPPDRRQGLARRSSSTCASASTATCRRSSWASSTASRPGQLMSRATVDLQSIRFFLGYGLIFLTQNALTIAARERGDVRDQARGWRRWRCCRCRSWSSRRRASTGSRGRRVQEVQQRIAELTAEAEESISGIRIVKAFAREEHMLDALPRARSRASSTRTSTRPGCGPSTRRCSASCRASGWRWCCSSAAAR